MMQNMSYGFMIMFTFLLVSCCLFCEVGHRLQAGLAERCINIFMLCSCIQMFLLFTITYVHYLTWSIHFTNLFFPICMPILLWVIQEFSIVVKYCWLLYFIFIILLHFSFLTWQCQDDNWIIIKDKVYDSMLLLLLKFASGACLWLFATYLA